MTQKFAKLLVFALFASASVINCHGAENPCFTITVVDDQTGRGVPLVELRTVSEMRFYTDSNGVVALNEPALMGREIFFFVKSHGYEFPKDGFGSEGKTLGVKPGASAELKIRRLNIAERLYRITGEGIYRDSVLAGKKIPIKQPLLNAQVTGQDSIQRAEYRGKLYWFWGDTNKQGYALGQFATSGAVSLKPGNGGLDPALGIDLNYFTGKDGFSRPMVETGEPGLKWIDNVLVVREDNGDERLICRCSRRKSLAEEYDRSLLIFNNKSESFETLVKLTNTKLFTSVSHAIKHSVDGQEYFFFCMPYCTVRVKADLQSLKDESAYEAFTCLKPGAGYEKENSDIERGADGRPTWGWKRNTAPIGPVEEKQLIASGKISSEHARYRLKDTQSGKPVMAHSGTVNFNAYKKKWIMLLSEIGGGPSFLGETWYCESDSPEGPWELAYKVVTHDRYTFYNVCHHPHFDQEGGHVIYFEGTYTATFSGNPATTPLYEYNQIMYRLDLADPRLNKK
jgi:hypothetical protein